jgi:hypothetical protein
VRHGHAEHRHHRVADELLDGTPMAFDHGTDAVEVGGLHPSRGLGIEPLREGGGSDQVAEEGRDHLPLAEPSAAGGIAHD